MFQFEKVYSTDALFLMLLCANKLDLIAYRLF